MGKQINQYTKTRIKTSTQSDDLMDLDSTEDSGVTFESAKMKVSEFIGYILEQIPPLSLYVIDGTISANRTVTALGRFTKWVGGNITIKMADAINNYGFTIEDNLGLKKAEMGYDQSTSSGFLKIDDNDLYVNDGFVGVGTNTVLSSEKLRVNGGLAVFGGISIKNSTYYDNRISMGAGGSILMGSAVLLEDRVDISTQVVRNSYNKFAHRESAYTFNIFESTVGRFALNRKPIPSTTTFVFNTEFVLNSEYWNGTSTASKEGNIIHKLQVGNTGNSQLDFKIDGNTLVTMMDNGRVGIGTLTPNASAITEMSSTTQGFLKPVMTTTQRDAIATPAAGLEIFNTSTAKMNFYDGDVWKVITSS